jgi:hypothetical protein
MNKPPEQENDLVYYDGRLMPASQVLEFAQEDAKRQADPKQLVSPRRIPKPTPVSEWDQQGLDLDARFKTFRNEVHARGQLLNLLRTIQTTKQVAEIAEQQAKQVARTQLLTVLRATQTAKQDAEIAEQKAEVTRQEAVIARLASWGFRTPIDPEHLPADAFTFAETIHYDWCRYNNEKWLIKFLQNTGYPEDFLALGVITRMGYSQLIKKESDDNRPRKTEAKRAERKKQALFADPLPEPKRERSSPKSKSSKEKE